MPYIMLHAPSDVSVGNPFEVTAVCFTGDDTGTVNMGYTGTLRFNSTDSTSTLPPEYTFKSSDNGIYTFTGFIFNTPGIYQIRAAQVSGDYPPDIISAPVRCHSKAIDITKERLNIYWGDLHGHTGFSMDALGDPGTFYPWARDVACLDFCMMADHHHSIIPAEWTEIRNLAAMYLDPGRFVTFAGYEWGEGYSLGCLKNHQNIVYLGPDGDVAPVTKDLFWFWWFLGSKGKQCMTIPHHTAYSTEPGTGNEWDTHNKLLQPVVEIFSDHGCSEYYGNPFPMRYEQYGHHVQDALEKGYRFGIIGSSDNHLTRPGTNSRNATPYALTGLAAVYAPSLTRESVWNSLSNRHCYATSGARKIILEFRVNDHLMGSEVFVENTAAARELELTVAGTAKLRQIDIIKNNTVFASVFPDSWKEYIRTEDTDPLVETDYYYVRVTQEDNFQAWSSPVWIAPESLRPVPVTNRLGAIMALICIFGACVMNKLHRIRVMWTEWTT